MLLGRGAEQARIDALLAQARDGTSGALVIRGEPGIGKSALLRYAVGQCNDMTVLWATGMEAESELAFAGLSELLHPVLGLLGEIPSPQAEALAGALALGPPGAQDRFTISVATLSLLAAAAEQRPVLAVVDDAHWLDAPSRDALLFATRRLQADQAVLLFAARVGEPVVFEAPAIPELVLGGIDQESCNALLMGSGGVEVSPEVAGAILEATRGNPLAILEAPRVLTRAQLSGREPLNEPLPVGAGVQRSFARRVARLPEQTRRALLVAAASQSRSIDEVRRACEVLGIDYAALEPAERDGLIENDGVRIQFGHPLMRAAVYHRAAAPDRRAVHCALASALAGEPFTGQRAWHLAAAAEGADEQVAAVLEEAGREARERSGYASAASMFEKAARLTPDPEHRARRLLEAGVDAHAAGDWAKALDLLGEALSSALGATLRADIQHAQGRVEMWTRSAAAARRILVAAANSIEPHDAARAAMILVDAATTCYMADEPERGVLRSALDISQRAYVLGLRVGGGTEAAACGLLGKTLILLGRIDEGYPLLDRCHQAIEESDSVWLTLQLIQCVIVFIWLEEFNRARRPLERLIARSRSTSAPAALLFPLCNLSEIDFREGHWREAYAGAAEAAQLSEQLGQTTTLVYALVCLACVEAAMGLQHDCRRHATAALDITGWRRTTITGYALATLGLLELGLGHNHDAIRHLAQLSDLWDREGAVEEAVFQFAPNLIEAYTRVGARTEAEVALTAFRARATGAKGTWTRATESRCRGLVEELDFDGHFLNALRLHGDTSMPFERARTELCYGERLRRAKRRAEARERLSSALEAFERLGAEPWAERARGELRATGLTARKRDRSGAEQLTMQELQVALKVATGATNREVAAELFLSPKTIEAHLGRVYGKLGLRSRTELAHHFRHETSQASSAPA